MLSSVSLVCPRCATPVVIEQKALIFSSFSPVISKESLSLVVRGIADIKPIKSDNSDMFFCVECKRTYTFNDLLVVSQLTTNRIPVADARIVYITVPSSERQDNKIEVLCPPMIIGKGEIELAQQRLNYYKDPQLLKEHKITQFITEYSISFEGEQF